MRLTVNFMFAVLFTGMTGMIFSIGWKVLSVGCKKSGGLRVSYRVMQVVMVLWLLPIAYLFLRISDLSIGAWGGNLFWGTPMMMTISVFFLIVWVTGCGIFLVHNGVNRFQLAKLCKTAMPCKEEMERIFRKMTEEMGVVSCVRLARSYEVPVPCVTGVFHPLILLPVRDYTEDELQKIFRHELTHVRHGDLVMKNLAIYVRAAHFMNPLAWWMLRQYEELSECACDFEICQTAKEIKEYYSFILQQAQTLKHHQLLMIGIGGDKNRLMRRMRTVIQYRTKVKKSVAVTALLATVMMFCSVTSVYAASVKSADFLAYVNNRTDVAIYEEQDVFEEYIETEADPVVAVYDGDVTVVASGSLYSFEWSVPKNSYKQSSAFTMKKGQVINVYVYNKSGNSMRVGIICPDGSKKYTTGTTTVSKVFSADAAGTYRVYVQNMSNKKMTVTGNYTLN